MLAPLGGYAIIALTWTGLANWLEAPSDGELPVVYLKWKRTRREAA